MRKYVCIVGILVLAIVVIGCGKQEAVSSQHEAEISIVSEEEDILVEENFPNDVEAGNDASDCEEIKEVEAVEEDIHEMKTQEASVEEPYEFRFVDVFGEEYETTIKVDFPKTVYEYDHFVFENGKAYYEDDGYSSRQGIDVSNHQGYIDWEKVKKAGIDFAIIRIGYRGYAQEGTLNIDKEFQRNIQNAQAAGIDVGVYIFSQAICDDEAKEEAEFVIKNLEGYELQLPVVYDPESILNAKARTDDVPGEQFTKNTTIFCEMIKNAGYEPMIYSNMLWEAFEFDMEQLNEYPFWYADYEMLPQTPYAFEMWQYSNKGRVDGINGVVDLDIQFIRK